MIGEYADLYELPALYDILHTPGTAWEVDVLERVARRCVSADTQVWLEPGCGTGRYLRVAAGRGHQVIGVDSSHAMIEYAQKTFAARGLAGRAQLTVADMTEFHHRMGRRRAHFAFNLINTIRHLDSDKELMLHLEEVFMSLKPGGLYAVGISLSRYAKIRPFQDVVEGQRGRCSVTQLLRCEPPRTPHQWKKRREMVESHIVVERPRGTTHYRTDYGLRCYDLDQWTRILSRSPFEVEDVVDEDGRSTTPSSGGYATWLLRKPARLRR